jgi:hypothetical protein
MTRGGSPHSLQDVAELNLVNSFGSPQRQQSICRIFIVPLRELTQPRLVS